MLHASTKLGRIYAAALFELAQAKGAIGEVLDALKQLGDLYDKQLAFRAYFTSPRVPPEEKQQFLTRAFAGTLPPLVMNLLHVLVAKRRETALDNVVAAFAKYRDEAERRMLVDVTTAQPLSEALRMALLKVLGARFPEQAFVLSEQVDARVLGGMRVRAGDRLVDGSVATRLNRLRQELFRVVKV